MLTINFVSVFERDHLWPIFLQMWPNLFPLSLRHSESSKNILQLGPLEVFTAFTLTHAMPVFHPGWGSKSWAAYIVGCKLNTQFPGYGILSLVSYSPIAIIYSAPLGVVTLVAASYQPTCKRWQFAVISDACSAKSKSRLASWMMWFGCGWD